MTMITQIWPYMLIFAIIYALICFYIWSYTFYIWWNLFLISMYLNTWNFINILKIFRWNMPILRTSIITIKKSTKRFIQVQYLFAFLIVTRGNLSQWLYWERNLPERSTGHILDVPVSTLFAFGALWWRQLPWLETEFYIIFHAK